MKRMFGVAMICAGLATPLVASAQGGSMMGGARGGSTVGAGSSSTMGGGTSMMGGDRGGPNASGPRAPASMSEGEVRKVDSAAGKLTLRHGALQNVDMPAMTMVFRVRDPSWLQQVRVGDKVRFVAERVDGNLTVTALEPEKQ